MNKNKYCNKESCITTWGTPSQDSITFNGQTFQNINNQFEYKKILIPVVAISILYLIFKK
jgi:hypothetical protein